MQLEKSSAATMCVRFIDKASVIHGDKYDYSEVEYINSRTKVKIICAKHGAFWITPKCHIQNRGCKECWLESLRDNQESIINKFISVHSGKYDYSKVKFVDRHTKVLIICKKHGTFGQTPLIHVRGHGCTKCANTSKRGIKRSYTSMVSAANKVHAAYYTYGNIIRADNRTIIDIICPVHGIFRQDMCMHLSGRGCKKCSTVRTSNVTRRTDAIFLQLATKVHGDTFDYSLVDYINCKTPVIIICRVHGPFNQTPSDHLRGAGCRSCSLIVSNGHRELLKLLPSDVDYIVNDRSVIAPKELDIYIPKYKLGIEHHGYYWHSYNRRESFKEKYAHSTKHDMAKAAGLKLLQVFDFETNRVDILKSMLAHHCNRSRRIHARKCQFEVINSKDAGNFFRAHHLQGHRPTQFYAGLVFDNKLCCAISLSKKDNECEIIRFATIFNHYVVGGFSKLLTRSMDILSPRAVTTFADRRFSNGNVYLKNGFRLSKITAPGYKYISSNGKVLLSRYQCQKGKLHKLLGDRFDNNLSECENMFWCGYRRLWDAGHYKFQKCLPQSCRI